MGFINNDQKFYLIENILAFIKKDYFKIIKLHLQAGTISSKNKIENLECELRFIFDPILNKKINDISFEKILPLLLNLFSRINMELQPNLLLFQKTLISIEGIARHLNPYINLWFLTFKVIEKIFINDIIFNKIITSVKDNFKKKEDVFFINKIIKKKKKFSESLFFLFSTFFFYCLVAYSYILIFFIIILEYYQYLIFFL
jgi:predicted unusual protein kinase regulating ubiquinone biosynthesis (AarF/ABC1/UbiB family)